jgi:hypothetical protein
MYQERATGHGFSPARLGPWVAALENELIDFPTGAHDDQVDVLPRFFEPLRQRVRVWKLIGRFRRSKVKMKAQHGIELRWSR